MRTDANFIEQESNEYIEFLEFKIAKIDEKIKPLQEEKSQLISRIEKLRPKGLGSQSNQIILQNGFNPSTTNIGKILFILRESGKPMYTRDIINRLFELQPDLKSDTILKQKAEKNISTVISINQGDGKLLSRDKDSAGNYLFTLNPNYNA